MLSAETVPATNRLRALRQTGGWAIYGLVVRAKCNPTTGAVERRDYRRSTPVCQRIAAALGVPMEAIWPALTPDEGNHV